MKRGISFEIISLTVLLVTITSIAVALLFYYSTNSILISQEFRNIKDEVALNSFTIASQFTAIEKDARFLSGTPPVQGIIRALEGKGLDKTGGSSEEQWRIRLENIFKEFIKSNPTYLQLRFIGIKDRGREIVRVDRIDEEINVVQNSNLQSKGERGYFKETIKLRPDEVFISKIELNREHGKVAIPHTPVLRVGVPVYSEINNKAFGIMIINMDFGSIIRKLEAVSEKASGNYYLTNHQGDFLLAPEGLSAFAFDFGSKSLAQEQFPKLSNFFLPPSRLVDLMALPEDKDHGDVKYISKIQFDPGNPARFIGIIKTTPYSEVVEQSTKVFRHSTYMTALLILIAIAIAVYFSRIFVRPVLAITKAAKEVSEGNMNVEVQIDTKNEIGFLAQTFQEMISKLNSRTGELKKAYAEMEQKVEDRTQELRIINEELEQRVEKRTADLAKSTDELRKAKEEAEASGAFKAALSELSDIMHGSKEVNDVAKKVSRYLAEFLKLPSVGFFVKNNDGIFNRVADFGYSQKESISDKFEFGSGMIGQAAKEGKPLTLKDMPEYVRVAFGFGDAAPNEILLYPLVYNEQTIAILELSNFSNFSETQLDWIKQASNSITLALQSLLALSTLKEILHVEWNESYDVGVKLFNDQHKQLFLFINALFDVMSHKKSTDTVGEVLDGLLDYTATHLADEEKVMQEHGYPGYEAHKRAHDELVSDVTEIRARVIGGKEILTADIVIFLVNWLKNHIKKMDKSYEPFLNRKGVT